MTDSPQREQQSKRGHSSRRSTRGFTIVLLLVLGLTLAFSLMIQPQKTGGLAVGAKAPEIQAEGWLNSSVAQEDLRGKLVVVDAWASWCLPCRRKAPELVALYEKFSPQGVVFVGLSSEPEEYRKPMENFLKDTGISWPNGYGATETLTQFQADYIPANWLIGRDGVILWNEDSSQSLEAAIQKALR